MRAILAIGAVGVIFLANVASQAQEASLQRRAEANERHTYELKVDVTAETAEMKYKAMLDRRFVEVKPDGQVVIATKHNQAMLLLAGQEVPYVDPPTTFMTLDGTGRLIELAGEDIDSEDYRFQTLNTLVWPKKSVEVGEKWEADLMDDEKTGTKRAKASYEVLAKEPLLGHNTIKIGFEIREVNGERPASAKGVAWVDRENGLLLKKYADMTNAPLAGDIVTARWEITFVPPTDGS